MWSGWRFNPAFGRCGALTTSRAMRFWLCLCAWRAQVQRRHVFPLRGTRLQGADAPDMWHVTASGQQLTAQSGDSPREQELTCGSQSAGRRYRQGCLTTTASGGDGLHDQNRREQVLGRQHPGNWRAPTSLKSKTSQPRVGDVWRTKAHMLLMEKGMDIRTRRQGQPLWSYKSKPECDNGARLVARRQGAGVEVRSLFAAHIHELARGGPSKIG